MITDYFIMKKRLFISAVTLVIASFSFAQITKKPVDFTLYDSWKSLSGQQVSDDGNWLAWTISPLEGDGTLFLSAWGTPTDKKVFVRGSQPNFAPNSEFIAFRINPQADTVRKAKLNKVKPEKMPKDTLGIFILKTDQLLKYANIKSFKVAEEATPWIAFQTEEAKPEAKPEKKDSSAAGKKDEKQKKKPEFNGQPLIVMNPLTRDSQNFQYVTEYAFSKHGNWLYMVSIKEDSLKVSGLRKGLSNRFLQTRQAGNWLFCFPPILPNKRIMISIIGRRRITSLVSQLGPERRECVRAG
jgi:hypothetical protein